MKSQVITSIIFIGIGLILLIGYPITLIYSIPLILIGLALYLFRGREAIIEHPRRSIGSEKEVKRRN